MTTVRDIEHWQAKMGECGAVLVGNTARFGSCRICGEEGYLDYTQYWDCDDGWKLGKLCVPCFRMAQRRGPHADDYAVVA